MKNKTFNDLIEKQFQTCRETLEQKRSEYAPDDDRLQNFRKAANLQGFKTVVKAIKGMSAKHTVAWADYISRIENGDTSIPWEEIEEKSKDQINYILLEKASLLEWYLKNKYE